MIKWLYVCAGISVSYNRSLDITRDLANRILHQYECDGVFIPCNLKKNIFTIIAKDNIDHNARATTATKHYHGTSFSVFQFPFAAFPGNMISFPDELPTTMKLSNSEKVDSLPSSYREIRRFVSTSFKIPVLPVFDSLIQQQGVKEEYEWLESVYEDKTSYWVPWSKHHAGKHQSLYNYLLYQPSYHQLMNCPYVAWSNGLAVKALDSQSRGPVFKTAGWLQGRLSLSSFRGR